MRPDYEGASCARVFCCGLVLLRIGFAELLFNDSMDLALRSDC